MISSRIPDLTTIGYCPLIPESPTQYSTVYTVLQVTQRMLATLNQDKKVITFDEAIYSKAHEIMWQRPNEYSDIISWLGGFHTALAFIATIGKVYDGSGLQDLWIESNVYAGNTTVSLIKGKSYNRCVRAHKLTMEAMERLQWAAFATWVSQSGQTLENEEALFETLDICHEAMDINATDELCRRVDDLVTLRPELCDLMDQFRDIGINESKTFAFWDQYIQMVQILL